MENNLQAEGGWERSDSLRKTREWVERNRGSHSGSVQPEAKAQAEREHRSLTDKRFKM